MIRSNDVGKGHRDISTTPYNHDPLLSKDIVFLSLIAKLNNDLKDSEKSDHVHAKERLEVFCHQNVQASMRTSPRH